MENQEENLEPPGPQTRRASKAKEEARKAKEKAKKVEEQRILDELPHVMMVGLDEEVRQRGVDKVHDEGRRQLGAILRGEGGGGNSTIKEEVVEEDLDEGREELDALQQGDEAGEGVEDVAIKEEVSEGEMFESNPVGSHELAEGQAVAIPLDLLQELQVKEEEQDEGGHLVISGGLGEGGQARMETEAVFNLESTVQEEDTVVEDNSLAEEVQKDEDRVQVGVAEILSSGSGEELRQDEALNIATGEGEVGDVVGEVVGEGGAGGGQEETEVATEKMSEYEKIRATNVRQKKVLLKQLKRDWRGFKESEGFVTGGGLKGAKKLKVAEKETFNTRRRAKKLTGEEKEAIEDQLCSQSSKQNLGTSGTGLDNEYLETNMQGSVSFGEDHTFSGFSFVQPSLSRPKSGTTEN